MVFRALSSEQEDRVVCWGLNDRRSPRLAIPIHYVESFLETNGYIECIVRVDNGFLSTIGLVAFFTRSLISKHTMIDHSGNSLMPSCSPGHKHWYFLICLSSSRTSSLVKQFGLEVELVALRFSFFVNVNCHTLWCIVFWRIWHEIRTKDQDDVVRVGTMKLKPAALRMDLIQSLKWIGEELKYTWEKAIPSKQPTALWRWQIQAP